MITTARDLITACDLTNAMTNNNLSYEYNSVTNEVNVSGTFAIEDFIASSYMNIGKKPLKPDKIIFNPPATIVYWNDGTKTVVKTNGDYFTTEGGLFAALARKMWGRAQTKKFMKQAKHVITTANVDRWMHYGK